ncbi:MAG TPA: HNH endonuclease, partial [Nocardioides sp.]
MAVLKAAYEWAVRHPADSVEGASTFSVRGFGDSPVALGGVGCPLVAELSVAEFAAAVGLGQESGKHLIGQALELRHRLPRLWARVAAGEVTAWRARRIADATIGLDPAAAGFVDTHVYAVAHNSRPWQLDRL